MFSVVDTIVDGLSQEAGRLVAKDNITRFRGVSLPLAGKRGPGSKSRRHERRVDEFRLFPPHWSVGSFEALRGSASQRL